MKVLVTGGTGVIGTGLITQLLKAGHELRLLARSADQAVQDYPAGVTAFPGDVTDPGSLRGAAEGCQAVIHITGIAEEHPPEVTFQSVNVEGTRNILLEAIKADVPRFIYLSSLGAERGQSDYHKSKREAELIVQAYPRDWVILRPGNVYGPHDDVLSTLLKMVRTLPVVPVVEGGDQPFQPIWHEDLGKAILLALTMPDISRRTLELAGGEITNTAQVIDRFCQITNRSPMKVAFPTWLAQLGVKVAEKIGANSNLAEKTNLSLPLNSSKLQMLMEENVIRDPMANALIHLFKIEPTPLDDGLVKLADALPEMSPDQGIGKLQRKQFSALIFNTAYNATELCNQVRNNINEIMPIDFQAEPGTATKVEPGATFTGSIPGRGNIQVRVLEDTPTKFSLITVEGHPLAGMVSFSAKDVQGGVKFQVETIVRASNFLDWIAMKTFGESMQDQNWVQTVGNVVKLSRGTAANGIEKTVEKLSEEDAKSVEERIEGKLHSAHRQEKKGELYGNNLTGVN